ncbi:MAG TPA: DUF368 domain-containing protein [Candidatus Coprenecus stercoravium]|uniref:DUF368 domain-containing protein n=1 Tax=Candidatus Coprenecus stercoravium TaxID=2840735 RepID=A0A9D2GPE4_9BACT|nr:DUF368 domain-containing protein [Candidatus Coprenecus stercoravium]
MGAADVIPGVSGGTIAFLTGIYEELLNSIKSINTQAFKLLFTGKIGQFWKHINGNFLISLILGIAISFFSLAKLMQYLMANEPIPLWSFFFGLIIASAILILKDIDLTKIRHLLALVLGIAAGAAICLISPTETPNELWFIFLCGAIAICAMILPGISGSFILLLLGKYEYMLKALTDLNIPLILIFVAGAAIGIISFSHFLTWLLNKYHVTTISALAGIMIGSLVKVWPWQFQHDGVSMPVLPFDERIQTGLQSLIASGKEISDVTKYSGHIGLAVLFALIGIALVLVLESAAARTRRKAEQAK